MSRKIAVLGGGESGAGAAVLAKTKGMDVWLSDSGPIKEKYKQLLNEYGISWEENGHTESKILDADEVVKSPGIPESAPIMQKIKSKSIPVISEIELAGRYTDAKMVCITGSNGKTTTSMLTYHILKDAGLNVGLAGNVGSSLALQVATEKHDVYVVELSSFQLDNMYDFKANIAVILNITPDHLNRHKTMENYIRIKEAITLNQTEKDAVVLNYDDPILREFGEREDLKPQVIWFSSREKLKDGLCMDGDAIVWCQNGRQTTLVDVHEMQLLGQHNYENAMAAAAIGLRMGVPASKITKVLKEFKPVEHRIEFVRERTGVRYYNDSKGTNPDAAIRALRAMPGPTLLIAGGYDKNSTYDEWVEEFAGRVKYLVLIGQTRDKIAACAKEHGFTEIMYAEDMQEAVQVCAVYADSGDCVLLSPACASWGMFKNYEERGRIFKECVMEL